LHRRKQTYCIITYGTVLFGTIWYYLVLFGTIWYCLVLFGTVWYYLVLFGTVWYLIPGVRVLVFSFSRTIEIESLQNLTTVAMYLNLSFFYRKGLRRTAAVKLENRVLGIKFKNLSLVTQYLRYSSFTAVLNLS